MENIKGDLRTPVYVRLHVLYKQMIYPLTVIPR